MAAPQSIVEKEFVVEGPGKVRQAGTVDPGSAASLVRKRAERELFYFATVFMGGNILCAQPHGLFCDFIQQVPKRRKLLLAPRNHLKTTLTKALVLHAIVQPDGNNVYFPSGMGSLSHTDGRSTRILLASKAAKLSLQKLSSIRTWCEANPAFAGFWPEHFWSDPRRESAKWNNERLQFPRKEIFDQATVEIVGVGGVVVGQHFNMHIHDDLIDEHDRYSPTTMDGAYNWLVNSRSLFDGQETAVEMTIGTHWANNDMYVRMEESELEVEVMRYSALVKANTVLPFTITHALKDTPIIELSAHGAEPLWPEAFSMEALEMVRRDYQSEGKGDLFPLNYLNDPLSANVVDFNLADFRYFAVEGSNLTYAEDVRDEVLRSSFDTERKVRAPQGMHRGKTLREAMQGGLRDTYFSTTKG